MYIPLMANDLEHLFGYLFVICISSSVVAQTVKCLPTMQETQVQSLGKEDLLEKEMSTHSSTLSWKIPTTEEPGRLYSPWGHKESDITEQLHFHFIEQQRVNIFIILNLPVQLDGIFLHLFRSSLIYGSEVFHLFRTFASTFLSTYFTSLGLVSEVLLAS